MKVTTNKKETVYFKEVEMGTFFFYGYHLFLKVNDNNIDNAYCFEEEEFTDFYDTDSVIPISTDGISIDINVNTN